MGGLGQKSVSGQGQCVIELLLATKEEGYSGMEDTVDGLGGTVLGDRSNARYVDIPNFNTEEVGTCVVRMGLRPKYVPLFWVGLEKEYSEVLKAGAKSVEGIDFEFDI